MRSPVLHVLGVVAAATIVAPIPSSAQQCSGLAEYSGSDMLVSKPESGVGNGLSYFTLGPALYAVWGESGQGHTGGEIKFVFSAGSVLHELGHQLGLNHGGPVQTADNVDVLFVTSDNGRLYKVDAETGAVLASADTRRASCPDDKVLAPPAVLLFNQSNPVFQNAMLTERGQPDDVVYVATTTGCGDATQNRVIAYYASTLTIKWVFNDTFTSSMLSARAACAVDQWGNLIFVATCTPSVVNGPARIAQNEPTLWSLDALTGALKWSQNAGSILNRPTLDRAAPTPELYVASSDGVLQKRDPSDGSLVWMQPAGSPIIRDIWAEFRAPQPTRIFFVAEDGQLHTVIDDFPSPVVLPPVSPGDGSRFSTAPAVAPGQNKIFIGRSDGKVQQLTLAGEPGPTAPVGRPGTVFDPNLTASSAGAAELDRLDVTTTERKFTRLCSSQQCFGLSEVAESDATVSPPEQRPGDDLSYFTLGPVLYAVWGESGSTPPHTSGDFKFSFQAGSLLHEIGHNLGLGHGGRVTTDDSLRVLFVASDNGRLYKLDANTGAVLAHVDLRRPGCTGDKLVGTPAVQLYRFANPVFQSAILAARGKPDDMVYMARLPGCGDPTGQVIGCFASDLVEAWESDGHIDNNCDGLLTDGDSNTLYLAASSADPGTNSLYAYNSASGGLKWSTHAGAITARPMIRSGGPVSELYVASSDGTLQKRNPSDGSLIWSQPTGSPIVRNLGPLFRPGQPTRIFFVAGDGQLHTVLDNFPNPVVLSPESPGDGSKFSTAPAVVPELGKIFIGRDDGRIQQLLLSGALGSTAPAGPAGTLCDPGPATSTAGTSQPDRLMMTTSEGKVRRFCIGSSTAGVEDLPLATGSLLAQNAPNPFSTRTLINYALPWDARVEIDIFGVDGRRLRTLIREQEAAGPHTLTWNGLDDAGRGVGNGTYFYRLRATARDGRALERTRKIEAVR